MQNEYKDYEEGLTSPSNVSGYGMSDAMINEGTQDTTMNEKDFDGVALTSINKHITDGVSPSEVFDGVDRPNFHKGLYYNKLINNGVDTEQAMKMSNVKPEQVERANQGFFTNFVDGVKADYTMLAYGIRAAGAGMGIMEESVDMQAERKLFVAKYDKDNEFRKGYLSTYDDDGDRDEPWNWGAGLGEMLMDVAGGWGAGAGAKTLAQTAVRDILFTTTSEGLKYQLHEDKIRLGMGIGSSIAGNFAGSWIQNKWFKGRPNYTETKSVAELDEQLQGLKLLEDSGIPITPDMLADPKLLQQQIDASGKNPFEREALTEALGNMKAELTTKIFTMSEEIGTTPSMFARYRAGELSDAEMGKKFGAWISDQRAGYRAQENTLYNKAKEVDRDPTTNEFRTYDINKGTVTNPSLLDKLNDATRRSPEASAVIRNEIAHIKRTVGDKVAKGRAKVQDAFGNLEKINNVLPGKEAKVAKALDQQRVLKLRLKEQMANENTLPSTILNTEQQLAAQTQIIKSGTDSIKKLKNQRKGYITISQRFKDEVTEFAPITKEGDPMPDNLTANELVLLQRRISEKMNVAGGTVSLNDKNTISALLDAHKIVKQFTGTKVVDTRFTVLNDAADIVAQKRFALMGRDSAIIGIHKAMKSKDPRDMYRLIKGDHGWSNLKHLGNIVGTDNPIYMDVSSKKIYDSVMDGVSKATGATQHAEINFTKLAQNLGNKDLMKDIESVAPPGVADFVRGLKYIAEVDAEPLEAGLKQLQGTGTAGLKDLIHVFDFLTTSKNELHNMFIRNPMKLRDSILGGGNLARNTQEMPLIGQQRWFEKEGDIRGLINYTKARLNAAKTQPERQALVKGLEHGMRSLTYRTLTKALGEMGRETRGGATVGAVAGGYQANENNESILGGALGGAAVGAVAGNVGKKVIKGKTSRPGYIEFGRASTDLPSVDKVPFDSRRISDGDKKNMAKLKTGDTVTDMDGNTYKKSSKNIMAETSYDGKSTLLDLGGAGLDSKAAKKARPGTTFLKDGKYYKREQQTSWEQVNHKKSGNLHVDSQTNDFTDHTKAVAAGYETIQRTPTKVDESLFDGVKDRSINTNDFLKTLEDTHNLQIDDMKEDLTDYYMTADRVATIKGRAEKTKQALTDTLNNKNIFVLDDTERKQIHELVMESLENNIGIGELAQKKGTPTALTEVAYQARQYLDSEIGSSALTNYHGGHHALPRHTKNMNTMEAQIKESLGNQVGKTWNQTKEFENPYAANKYKEAFDDLSGEVAKVATTPKEVLTNLKGALSKMGRFKTDSKFRHEADFELQKAGVPSEARSDIMANSTRVSNIESDRMDIFTKQKDMIEAETGIRDYQYLYEAFETEWADVGRMDPGMIVAEIKTGRKSVNDVADGYTFYNEAGKEEFKVHVNNLIKDYGKIAKYRLSPEFKKTSEKVQDLYHEGEALVQKNAEIVDGYINKAADVKETLEGAKGKNPGTATMQSPLDNAIYNRRVDGMTESMTGREWLKYLRAEKIPDDELTSSGLRHKLATGDEVTLEEVEQMLKVRSDYTLKKNMGTSHSTITPRDGNNNNYGIEGKFSNEYETVPGSYQDKLEYNSESHFGDKMKFKDLISHTRSADYMREDGIRVKRLIETQADGYQKVPKESFKDLKDFSTKKSKSTYDKELFKDDMGDDENYNMIAEAVQKDLDISGREADNFAAKILNDNIESTDIKIGGMTRTREALDKVIMDAVPIGPGGIGRNDIPSANTWWQKSFSSDIVDAYNSGYGAVEIPIGEVDGKVQRELVRTEGVTKWLRNNVMPWLEKTVGKTIKSSSVKYDPKTEMLMIDLPTKPFNITPRGNVPK